MNQIPNQQTEAPAQTPSPGPAQTPATPATPTLPRNASAEDVLKFNPFAKGPSAGPDGGKAGNTVGSETPAQQAQAAPNQQQPTLPAASNVTDPSIEAIRSFLTMGELGQEAPAPVEPKQEQENAFRVNWGVPPEILEGIRSEEPQVAMAAMTTLTNGLANGVLGIVQQRLQEVMTGFMPQLIQQQIEAAEINRAFYSKYDYLSKPELAPVIGKVAQAVARHWKTQGKPVNPKDSAFMAAVEGYMVANGLAQRPVAAPGQQQTQPTPQPAAPYFGSNGGRATVQPTPSMEDIASQLGL